MVIPSRWMAGGRGLSEFRAEFLSDQRLRALVDYENAKDAFPTVGIGGGICYFLWDRDNPGLCECLYHRNGATIGPHPRVLDEFDVFVRDKRAVDILHKVVAAGERPFEELVSGDSHSVWRRTSGVMYGMWCRRMGRSVFTPTLVLQGFAALWPVRRSTRTRT